MKMAAPPHGPQGPAPRYRFLTGREWAAFFLGTPRRLLTSAGLALVAFGVMNPDAAGQVAGRGANALGLAVGRTIQAAGPAIENLLVLGVMLFGLRVMIWGWPGKGKKK
jgi:hypothetical protein